MIIVTGGAGLIGSAVVWALNSSGIDDILIVDHLGISEKWRNLAPLKFRDYVEKDRFTTLIDGALADEKIEAVIHLGACSSTTERDVTYLAENNFEYSKRTALFAFNKNARFIYASSAATYGDGELGFSDDHAILHSLRPLNPYGYSKQIFDLWLLHNGLIDKAVGLKYFNVFGPNEHHKGDMRSVVLKAFEQIQKSGGMTLFKSYHPDYKDGEQLRDFVYVKDAAAMTLFFLENRTASGIFNVGTGKARCWNDMAKALFSALQKEISLKYVDMPESIRDRYQYYTCAENSKIRSAGFTGKTHSLEEAVKDYAVNYLLHDKRLGDLAY